MSTLVLGLLIIFVIATVTFFIAGGLYSQGSPWARDVCSLSQALCDQPAWGGIATGVIAAIYLVLRSFDY
jgi:hypothetical protein